MYTDEQLIKYILSGNNQMFRDLINRYQHKVYSISLRFTNNQLDAEDVAQEIFLQAYKSLPTFNFDSNFSTWLYRISINKGLDWKKNKKNLVTTDEFNEQFMQKDITDIFLEDLILKKDDERNIRRIIAKLPETYKSVITLYYFDNLSYKEIALKLNVAKKTVESRLYRGKIMMKELSKKEGIK